MTPRIMNALLAGAAALTIATAGFAGPAEAGGSLSLTLTPHNARQENAMRMGLGIYGLVNAVQNGASIRQDGFNNAAGIGQNGFGNLGIVHQDGNGHNGSVQQNGNNNAYGLFQFGENTNGHVVQNGNGQVGTAFQFGW